MRSTSGMLGSPPIMNRSFAAWFMIWSKATPAKSENWSSTTGRSPVRAAPIPQPTKPLSVSGVSRIRSAPKRSYRPSVARKSPPTLPTSSPITNTSGSASSSSSRLSRTAATKLRARSVSTAGAGWGRCGARTAGRTSAGSASGSASAAEIACSTSRSTSRVVASSRSSSSSPRSRARPWMRGP